MSHPHTVIIRGWFAFNAIVSLTPPVYWFASQLQTDLWGMPATVCYFLLISFSITASIVYAYLDQLRNGTLES